jgi:DNA-binding transcriptional MerR regulator
VESAERPVLSISAVARILGVPPATIRSWEDRYRLVIPARTATGQRLYRRNQVEQLRFVRARMAEGLNAADAHRLLAERLDAGSLPRAQFPDPADPADPAAAGTGTLATRTSAAILLAESDPYAAEMQENFLTSAGFEVDIVLTEAQARRALTGHRPAVAVIEPLISGGRGLDLCLSFKRSGVPVIVASVLQVRERALAAGADAFLGKPLKPQRLLSAIRDLLAESPHSRPRAEVEQ